MNWNEYHARDESPGGGAPEAQAERVDANPNLVVDDHLNLVAELASNGSKA